MMDRILIVYFEQVAWLKVNQILFHRLEDVTYCAIALIAPRSLSLKKLAFVCHRSGMQAVHFQPKSQKVTIYPPRK
jgi:hypothetical protein